MDKKFILAYNWRWLQSDEKSEKLLRKNLIPFGGKLKHLNPDCKVTLKYRDKTNKITVVAEEHLQTRKDEVCFRADGFLEVMRERQDDLYFFVIVEGASTNSRLTVQTVSSKTDFFDSLRSENPLLRFSGFNIPPNRISVIDSDELLPSVYTNLIQLDTELNSLQADSFLQTPHILTALFSHVMAISSNHQIDYLSTLRTISDHLRQILLDAGMIEKIEKNHSHLWGEVYGKRITFVDGGMSRIVGLPGAEPNAIRVGAYSVTPGEDNIEKREDWEIQTFVIGDVLNDRASLEIDVETDSKRLLEAARYILELLSSIQYIERKKPDYLFLHGPLVYPFQTYDESDPNYIPGVSKEFLLNAGVQENIITSEISRLPQIKNSKTPWNQCIPVYTYLANKAFNMDIPFIGVVERSPSKNFSRTIFDLIVQRQLLNRTMIRKLNSIIDKYQITDEFLFGCILDEGEFIKPIELTKNWTNRAHEHWKPVVRQIPSPHSSILKTSAQRFPFRVETNFPPEDPRLEETMSLLYHTSRLLPNYAFPVGLDIVDKYVKVPDWLSKGFSAALTSQLLLKALQTGEPRIVEQTRQLLSRSPRDFFFRPTT